MRLSRGLERVFMLYLPLAVFLLWALFPVYWMAITAFKPDAEITGGRGNPLWVADPTIKNFTGLFRETNFPVWIRNSALVSVITTFLSVLVSSLAAYSLARLRFRGRWFISRSVLFSYLVPRTILFIPLFSILQFLRLTDSLAGLVVSYLTFMVPFCTWLLVGYFASVPREVEECGLIDGCTRAQVLFRITLPMALPGIITATIFSFTLSWNEFLYPLVFNTSSLRQVVPVGISDLQYGDVIIWGKIMAAGVVFSLPLILIYYPIQRFLVGGMTAGAVKG
jgi:multiple sugar transport system permease protein